MSVSNSTAAGSTSECRKSKPFRSPPAFAGSGASSAVTIATLKVWKSSWPDEPDTERMTFTLASAKVAATFQETRPADVVVIPAGPDSRRTLTPPFFDLIVIGYEKSLPLRACVGEREVTYR